jgi:hypothetical protein
VQPNLYDWLIRMIGERSLRPIKAAAFAARTPLHKFLLQCVQSRDDPPPPVLDEAQIDAPEGLRVWLLTQDPGVGGSDQVVIQHGQGEAQGAPQARQQDE